MRAARGSTLRECDHVWGGTRIDEATPAVERHYDVVFRPWNPQVWYEQDPTWGVYGADGHLIDAAAHRVGPGARLKGQSLVSDGDIDAVSERVADEALVYGGPLNPHYGHFLCSTLSRLWLVARDGLAGRRVVFHGSGRPADLWRDHAFAGAILGALGLGPQTVVVLKRPTRLDRLIIPRPSFQEQEFASRAYLHVADRVGRRLAGDLPRDRAGPVYLTKTGLKGGVGRVMDEAVIEAVLRKGGVEIVRPEALTLADQIGLFQRRRVVAGTSGSQFHTAVFAGGPSRSVCLSARPSINSNAVLFDGLRGRATRHLHAGEPAEEVRDRDGFLGQTRFADTRRVAQELLDAIWREDALVG